MTLDSKKYSLTLIICLICSICPASALQQEYLENNISPGMDNGALESNISYDKYYGAVEKVITNISYTNDVEQLYPQINSYNEKIYGETFYTCGGIILGILITYADFEWLILAYPEVACAISAIVVYPAFITYIVKTFFS